MLQTWNEISDDKRDTIPEGISITEFYDTLELHHERPNYSTDIEKFIKARMLTWQPSDSPNLMLDSIKSLNAPILTTNFDDLIPKVGIESIKLPTYDDIYYHLWET